MLRFVGEKVVAFDVETIPRYESGVLVYDLRRDSMESEVFAEMWKAAGGNEKNPQPFLQTHLVRICSVAAVVRESINGEVTVKLVSFPRSPDVEAYRSEASVLKGFFSLLEEPRPQLVGYNSRGYEMPLLLRSGLAHKLRLPKIFSRSSRRDGSVDYMDSYSDWHIDLMNLLSPYGVKPCSLDDIARVCAIPGKLGMSGADVATMWQERNFSQIVNYNEYDALTTYLLWLRFPLLAGLWSREDYAHEENLVRQLLSDEILRGKTHLQLFLDTWNDYQSFVERGMSCRSGN